MIALIVLIHNYLCVSLQLKCELFKNKDYVIHIPVPSTMPNTMFAEFDC